MKRRTDTSIIVGFVKRPEDVHDKLSYNVDVDSGNAHTNCDRTTAECTISRLSPGRQYRITVSSCIAASSQVCSDPSNEATIKTLPNGK